MVINFLNRKNAADQRVFELLSEKFRLFDGVFGASDEVLGAIESGVDFENVSMRSTNPAVPLKRLPRLDQLQLELEEQITAQLRDTRQAVGKFRRRCAHPSTAEPKSNDTTDHAF